MSGCAPDVTIDPATQNRIAGADPPARLLRHGVLRRTERLKVKN
jgi:hypothetical protein